MQLHKVDEKDEIFKILYKRREYQQHRLHTSFHLLLGSFFSPFTTCLIQTVQKRHSMLFLTVLLLYPVQRKQSAILLLKNVFA